jgi:hypothetical protein
LEGKQFRRNWTIYSEKYPDLLLIQLERSYKAKKELKNKGGNG